MNKYKEALSSILFTMHYRVKPKALGKCEDDNFEILQELVDKATPMKPFKESLQDYLCPICESYLSYDGLNDPIEEAPKYCSHCGQKIDWSKDETN